METSWDCIVVGGGAAGLSAALVLGRARRRTLVIDAGGQSNRPAHGIGGLLGHDGRPPAELYEIGRQELTAYPSVEVRDTSVVSGEVVDGQFVVNLADGAWVTGRRLLLATGVEYRYPALDGIAERWGASVFHCPFCHGWEVRDRALGVLGDGPMAVMRARLLRGWSEDVTLYTSGPAGLDPAEKAELASLGVAVEERSIAALEGTAPALEAVRFADGTTRSCGGLLVPITLHQRSQLAAQLGAAIAPSGPIAPEAVQSDEMRRTDVPGLYVAGDAGTGMPSVANAIASGSAAAAAIMHSLMDELVERRRDRDVA
jgi:thioredoxin reductase